MSTFTKIRERMNSRYRDSEEERRRRQEQNYSRNSQATERFTAVQNQMRTEFGSVLSNVDSDFIASFFSDAQTYIDSFYERYSKMGYLNREDVYSEQKERAENLRSRSWAIRQYLLDHKSAIGEDYNSFIKALDDFDRNSSEINRAFYGRSKDLSQYATEEDYIWGAQENREQRRQRYADNQKQIEALTAQRDALSPVTGNNSPFKSPIRNVDPNYFVQIKALDDQIAALQEENRKYENGEGGYVSKELDDNYEQIVAQQKQEKAWEQKYAGKSYGEIQGIIAAMGEGSEKDWLQSYAPTTMTVQDYDTEITNVDGEIARLQAIRNEWTEAANTWSGQTVNDPIYAKMQQLTAQHGSLDDVNKLIDQAKARKYELENGRKYGFLSQNADFGVQSNANATGYKVGLWDAMTGSAENHYNLVNGFFNQEFVDQTKENPLLTRTADALNANLAYLEPEEKKIYNYLHNTQGLEKAEEYLKTLKNTLAERAQKYSAEQWALFTKEMPDQANMLSIPLNLWSGIGYVDAFGQKIVNDIKEGVTGEYAGPVNYNSLAMAPSVASTTIRGTRAQNIADKYGVIDFNPEDHPILSKIFNGKGLADVYQLGMSMVDSAAVALLSPVMGTAGTLMLSGSAATQTMLDAVANGATDEQALMMGATSGAFEYLFEKYELENLLRNGSKNAVRAFVSQALSEGFGEGATTISNMVADTLIMADNSQLSRAVAEYMEANPGMTEQQATKQAIIDMGIQVAWDFAGGVVSGGVMGGGFSAVKSLVGNVESAKIGRSFQQSGGNLEGLTALAVELDSHSKEDLSGMVQQVNQNTSNRNVGRLYMAVAATVKEQNVTSLTQQLQKQGVAANAANTIADVVVEARSGSRLTEQQQSLWASLQNDSNVQAAVAAVFDNENSSVYQMNRRLQQITAVASQATASVSQTPANTEGLNVILTKKLVEHGVKEGTAQKVAELVVASKTGAEISEQQTDLLESFKKDRNIQAAIDEVFTDSTQGTTLQAAKNAGTNEKSTVTEDGADGEVDSAEGKVLRASSGKAVDSVKFSTVKNGKATVQLQDGSVVDAADISFASEGDQVAFRTLPEVEGMTAEAANAIWQVYRRGDHHLNAGAFSRAAAMAFRYGYRGDVAALNAERSDVAALPKKYRDMIYQEGRTAAQKQTKAEQANVDATYTKAKKVLKQKGNPGKSNYGVINKTKLSKEDMDPTQKVSYELAEEIAPAVSGNIVVYDGGKEWGHYNPATDEICLNVNAKWKQESMMAYTMGHELVHRAKKGSPAKFKAFADFLVNEYGKQGASVDAMIVEQIDASKEQGVELTEEEAFEEVVADACQKMLLDTDAGVKLAEFGAQSKQNRNFLRDLARWINELLDKLRSVFKNVEPDSMAAREFAKFEAGAKKTLTDMFVGMSVDAGEKLSAIKEAGMSLNMSEVVEESANLIAFHNSTPALLEKILKQNGLIMPSLAVSDHAISDFGEISLVFDKNAIDPDVSAENKLYGTDAWTPTQTELKKNARFNNRQTEAVLTQIRDCIGTKFNNELFRMTAEQFQERIRNADGSVYGAFSEHIGMQTAYAMQRGIINSIPSTTDGRVDVSKLRTKLHQELDTDNGWRQYKAWLNQISDRIISSFDAANNQDILKNMKAQPASAKTFKLSESGELVVPAVEYGSIEQLRQNKGRLSTNAAESTKVVANELLDFAKRMDSDLKTAVNAINKAFDNRYDTKMIQQTMAENGVDITLAEAADLQNLYRKAVELPTAYFEAKPHRILGLEEIRAVIMPSQESYNKDLGDLRQRLEEKGIRVIEYEHGNIQSRQAALDTVENVKFKQNVQQSTGKNTTDEGGVKNKNSASITMDDVNRLQAIGRKSVSDFTSAELKVAQKWAIKFFNELGVKSPFFRSWFGDWREGSIAPAEIVSFAYGETGKLNYKKRTVICKDMENRKITVDDTVIEDSLHYAKKHGDEKQIRKLLGKIDEILEKGILLDTRISEKSSGNKKGSTQFMHYLYTPISINGAPFIAKLSVEEYDFMGATRAYNLRRIELSTLSRAQFSQMIATNREKYAYSVDALTVSQLHQFVKENDVTFQPKPASKVVNPDGTPMVVYHGTSDQFTEFKHSELSDKEGSFFFAQNREDAEAYTSTGNVMAVYVNLQNPIDYNDMPPEIYRLRDKKAQVAALRKLGYDGWLCDMDTGWGEVSAFNANQIKSATDNIGTFDGGNPDIRYKLPANAKTDRQMLVDMFEQMVTDSNEYKVLQDYKKHIDEMLSLEEKVERLSEEIKRVSFAEGPRDMEYLNNLKWQRTQAVNRLDDYDKKLLSLEKSGVLKAMIERNRKQAEQKSYDRAREYYRQKSESRESEIRQYYRESRRQAVERHNQAEVRQQIRKDVQKLDSLLNHGSKEKNIKLELKEFAGAALRVAKGTFLKGYNEYDMIRSGVSATMSRDQKAVFARCQDLLRELDKIRDERNAEPGPDSMHEKWDPEAELRRDDHEEELKKELAKNMAILRDAGIFRLENELIEDSNADQLMDELMTAYKALQDSEQDHVRRVFSVAVYGQMEKVRDFLAGKAIKDMTAIELTELRNMYRMVLHTITHSNDLFAQKRNADVKTMGEEVIKQLQTEGKLMTPEILDRLKQMGWANLKPETALELIGSDTLTGMMQGLYRGEDTYARDIEDARKFAEEQAKKYGRKKWDMEKPISFAGTKITLGQAMSLYAYAKRAQAQGHLEGDGFTSSANVRIKQPIGNLPVQLAYIMNATKTHTVSKQMYEKVGDLLTPEQKKYADAMQEYLSKVMGAKGNEVSMQLYGIKLFEEMAYFPLITAQEYHEEALGATTGEAKLKNSGFTKSVQKGASNPIVLDSFEAVWAAHVDKMSLYHGFVLPMEDFDRVYNYHRSMEVETTNAWGETITKEVDSNETVKVDIQNKAGKVANDYIENFMKQLNGGVRGDSTEKLFGSMVRNFKKTAVLGSLSVTVQQPTAFIRAMAHLDMRDIADFRNWLGKAGKPEGRLVEEMYKYAPVALMKHIGGFDPTLGRATKDYIFEDKTTVTGALDKFLGMFPEKMDEWTWKYIWLCTKRQIHRQHPALKIGSEEFLQKTGERFSKIIRDTQVYDSVLTKSQIMRSKNVFLQMATSFMNEPTTSLDMYIRSTIQAKRGKISKAQAARTYASVVGSQLLCSAVAAFVYALRDDDEDETYWEKYVSAMISKSWENVLPWYSIPFVKDIFSIFEGYSVERSDMSIITDIYQGWQKLSSDNATPWEKTEAFAGSILNLFGVPLKNVSRDVRGVYNTISYWINNGVEGTRAGIRYAALEGLLGSKASKTEQMQNAIAENDAAHITRLLATYDSEEKAFNAFRTAVKGAFIQGQISEERAIEYLQVYAGNDQAAAQKYVNTWLAERETGIKYEDVQEAFLSGQITEEKAVEMCVQYGGDTTEDAEQKVTRWRSEKETGIKYEDIQEAFVSGEISEQRAVEMCVKYGGYTTQKAQEKVTKWRAERETGIKYEDIQDALVSGEISEQKAIDMCIKYGGYTAEEAQEKVTVWDFQGDYPDSEFTDAQILKYVEFAEPAGISVDVYTRYVAATADLQADKDANGNSISGSKRKKVLAAIHRLPLTPKQKDALYFANGYAKSTLNEAPWH